MVSINKVLPLAVSIGAVLLSTAGFSARASQTAPQPIIVELFSSEACNSCPPADLLLRSLEKKQPIDGAYVIGLEEHVDYWNHDGWSDPYSSAAFSRRQSDYASKFGPDTVYTPEMVVDGRTYFVGSDSDRAYHDIQQAESLPKAQITLVKSTAGLLSIHVTNIPRSSDASQVLLAVTQSDIVSNPTRGENRGATLIHSAVVRSFRQIATIPGYSTNNFDTTVPLKLSGDWQKDHLMLVVFIQNARTKTIVGAATAAG